MHRVRRRSEIGARVGLRKRRSHECFGARSSSCRCGPRAIERREIAGTPFGPGAEPLAIDRDVT